MRVIAGIAKGTRLGPVPTGVRPVSDRAREGVFASLGSRLADARCLDLFAGTGAMGIEALSRGASSCTFVDQAGAAVRTISANLDRAKLEGTVVRSDVLRCLRSGRVEAADADLVFADPPYEVGAPYLDDVLATLGGEGPSDRDRTVIVTRGQKGPLPAVPLHWAVARQLRYGDSLLIVYREVGWA